MCGGLLGGSRENMGFCREAHQITKHSTAFYIFFNMRKFNDLIIQVFSSKAAP
jgi:hypothetical protein